jgi:hypothetical protein
MLSAVAPLVMLSASSWIAVMIAASSMESMRSDKALTLLSTDLTGPPPYACKTA